MCAYAYIRYLCLFRHVIDGIPLWHLTFTVTCYKGFFMSIDIDNESLLSLAQASHKIPGRPTLRTLWRWVNHGVEGQRLETIKCGKRRFTSVEAIHRFIARGTKASSARANSTSARVCS